MYKNKDLKHRALKIFKKNKWTLIIISILMTVVIGEYALARDSQNNAHIINQIYQDQKNGVQVNVIRATETILLNRYATEMLAQLTSGQNNTIANVIKSYNEQNNVKAGTFFDIANFFIKGQEQIQDIINSSTNMSLTGGEKAILIVASSFGLIIKFLLTDPIIVGEKRVFLESIYYEKTKIQRITFPLRRKKYFHVVRSMALYRILSVLWRLTIIGWPIKAYSYKMVQFIIAENPEIKAIDAIKMSKEMMKGHKWQTFKLDASFLGWLILQYITLGIAGVFVTPYYVSTYAVLYETLRKEYIRNEKYRYELLNDDVLFINSMHTQYPEKVKEKKVYHVPEFDLATLVLFFFLFAIVGYIWEVLLVLFKFGQLINRGTLYGPWLPIYGFGCSSIMLFFGRIKPLKKLAKNPFATFVVVMIICTALEYFGSWIIEKLFNLRYWDYTGYFLNINGRVCFENALFFGIGGTIAMYIVAPFVYSHVSLLKPVIKISIITVLMTAIVIDFGYTLKYPRTGDYITQQHARRNNENLINSNLYIQI